MLLLNTFASLGRSVRPQYAFHEVPLYLKKKKLISVQNTIRAIYLLSNSLAGSKSTSE